jgi:DNA-directed RNA polymerase subunit beta'
MVLGLYYMTKGRKSTPDRIVKGEGSVFYSPEEVIIAYNEGKVALHSFIKVKVNDRVGPDYVNHMVETTVGRVLFNQVCHARWVTSTSSLPEITA